MYENFIKYGEGFQKRHKTCCRYFGFIYTCSIETTEKIVIRHKKWSAYTECWDEILKFGKPLNYSLTMGAVAPVTP